jgi:hypothetical protein
MPLWRRGAGARWRRTLLRVPLAVAAACWACAAPEPGPVSVQVALHPEESFAKPGYISVSGLNGADLSSLRERPMTALEWSSLLKVTVDIHSGLPSEFPDVLGRYAVTDSAVTFTPLFPFDPGRDYRVVFDPSHLPRPRQTASVTVVVGLPEITTEPTAVVAIHPSADVVPENLLRVYIEFSAPMGNRSGLDFVKLVELSGPGGDAGKTERIVEGAFLPVEADFWSPDHTRYTLFFDPGRVKDDILPNRESGRPLRAGGRYAIDIARSWTDANGRPLEAAFRHTFRAGPAVDKAIDVEDWKLEVPEAGTREALTVRFPRPLDHGIIVRALGVETGAGQPIDGKVAPGAHDAAWVFTPVVPWQGGEYNLVAQSFLEDPQGNQIGRAFEVSAGELDNRPVSGADAPSRVAFAIRTAP